MNAHLVGQLLGKQDIIGVVFAGGGSEIPHLRARQIMINDAHSMLINLYRVVTISPGELMRRLEACLYHPTELAEAKELLKSDCAIDRAFAFFVVNWMTRSAGGSSREINGNLAMRFSASGGSSIARWLSAVRGIPEWAALLKGCEFTCLEWKAFRDKWVDRPGHALYLDPPWIAAGDDYLHKFSIIDHYQVSDWVRGLESTTVVIRHADCEQYRTYYREDDGWEWFPVEAKNQRGNETGECLIRKLRK